MRSSLVFFAALAVIPSMASAETIRLSPEQAEAAIEAGAARRARTPELLRDGPLPNRGVHGEVGVAVGTGGYRSMYGVVGVPLGDSGGMVLGYSQERGRLYAPVRGDLCRGITAQQCDWRVNAAQLETNR